jgi:hypothetical protein
MTLRTPRHLKWDDRLPDSDKETVQNLNLCLDRLNQQRAVEINVAGHFARSKIAWKLATWQHALLHRVVALMDGIAVAWNCRCTLAAMLSARAFMETVAVLYDMEAQVRRLLADEDLGGLDAFAQSGSFAARDPALLEAFPNAVQATSALTLINKVDKRIPLFRKHYDSLSERCHPNALGHNFMFGTLDRSSGSVRYCDERDPAHNGNLIFSPLAILPIVENLSTRLDILIREVSEFHHRVAPVSGLSDQDGGD